MRNHAAPPQSRRKAPGTETTAPEQKPGGIARAKDIRWLTRLALLVGVGLLQILCFNLVSLASEGRVLWDFHTVIDDWIPYMGWTWVIYYSGILYFSLFGGVMAWRLPSVLFRRAVYTYVGMIVTGATLEIALPAWSPWPEQMVTVQRWFHDFFQLHPYACLPSMHVALSVLAACLSLHVLKSRTLKMISVAMASMISLSTVTLKEHFFLDIPTGLILGLVFYGLWRFRIRLSVTDLAKAEDA
jgi:hypothetical protein